MAYSSEIDKLRARYNENPKGRNFAPLADAYRKARQLDEAIALCHEGLQHHPDYVSAHIVLGRCLVDKKDDPGAEASFRRVLELDQENIIALKMLSDIAMRSGRAYEAVTWLTRLLQVDPMNGEAAEALAAARGQLAAPPVPLALEQAEPIEFEAPAPDIGPPPVATTLAEMPAATLPEPATPPAPPAAAGPPSLTLTEAPTEAMVQPDFSAGPPAPPPGVAGDGELESYDGTIDFSAVERDAMPLEGVAHDEPEIDVSAEDVLPTEGLARTQYEGSGMFRVPDPPAEEPAVSGLPLIMPEDAPPGSAAAPRPTQPEQVAPPPARTPPPAMPFSDDEGAADQSALSAAEPLVTETMAELYLQQGHVEDALRVYRALLESRPGDRALRGKVDELSAPRSEPSAAPPAQTAVEFLRRVFQGTPGAPPVAAASEVTPAPTVLDAVFGGADEPEELGASEASLAEPGMVGAPTQPATDALSLDRVFGESGAARATPAAAAKGAAVGTTTGFSFDEFFSAPDSPPGEAPGTPGGGAPAPRPAKAGEPEQDLDQFQAWLRSLKA